MSFKCGIVGLPNVGKSTLFNALTESKKAQAENFPFCTIDPNIGIVPVPDERLDKISKISKSEKKINAAIFPGTQGGPLMNMIAAKAQAFMEATTMDFKKYAKDVVLNAQVMCEVFKDNGFKVQTDGTDSHLVVVNLIGKKYSGREAADLLEENFNFS